MSRYKELSALVKVTENLKMVSELANSLGKELEERDNEIEVLKAEMEEKDSEISWLKTQIDVLKTELELTRTRSRTISPIPIFERLRSRGEPEAVFY